MECFGERVGDVLFEEDEKSPNDSLRKDELRSRVEDVGERSPTDSLRECEEKLRSRGDVADEKESNEEDTERL